MSELIERLTQATEGSRELDAEIYFAPSRGPIERHEVWHGGPERISWTLGSKGVWDDELPAYTTSLDAAMTLVPPGMEWHVSNRGQIGAERYAYAGVFGGPFVGSECDSHAATPALALCIAALRAREDR